MTAPFFFWFFAAIVVFGAVGVVAMRQPVHSALFLLLSFFGIAALFVTLRAEFLAAVQILVYAGGIMVLFLFVVMLVNPGVTSVGKSFQKQFDVALVLLPVFLLPFLYILGTEKLPDVASRPDAFRMVGTKIAGNTEAVAWVLFRDYLVPFEVASVFLLVAMVGAVVLGRRSLEKMD